MRTLGIVSALVVLAGCVWAKDWQMEYLPELPNTDSSNAAAINNRGQIVGWCHTVTPDSRISRAVLWESGHVFELPLPEGFVASTAVDVNDAGVVAGSFTFRLVIDERVYGASMAFIWTKNNGFTLIEPPYGKDQTTAICVDNSGTVYGITSEVGGLDHVSNTTRFFLWTPQAGMTVTEEYVSLFDLNSRGEMAGFVRDELTRASRAAIWRQGPGQ